MVINSGLVSDYAFLQRGYTYGVNDSGPWQRFERRGLNSDIETWAGILFNAGWTYTVTRETVDSGTDQGISRIEAKAGWAFPFLYGSETPENIWELDPQDEQKGLLEADFPFGSVNLTSKLTREKLALIVASTNVTWYPASSSINSLIYGVIRSDAGDFIFDDGTSGVGVVFVNALSSAPTYGQIIFEPYSGNQLEPVSHLPSADYDSAYSLYLMMKAGVEAFPMEASVIRHSQVTSNLYAVQASYNNMNRIISSASMYSIEGTPSALLFAVPNTPSPGQFIETAGDLQYGWRKVRPAVSRLSRMKWRVTQNYQLGLWPVKTFGGVL